MPQLSRGSREASCFPLLRGERVGGCWHHVPRLRQGQGSRAGRGCPGALSSGAGTTAARLTGLTRLPWLCMKGSASAGNLHTLGQVLHGSLPSQSQAPGCRSSPAPRAPGCRESTLSFSWVPSPLHAKGTALQQKGSWRVRNESLPQHPQSHGHCQAKAGKQQKAQLCVLP